MVLVNLYKPLKMKKLYFLAILSAFLLSSCKKDSVDASSTQNFRSSINDMTSSLNTLQQTKFNEALYILKTFGVNADGDAAEMNALRALLAGKKVPEIFALADEVAQKNSISWSSSAPPSLGVLNIFEDIKATESDPSDIDASGLILTTKPLSVDSILGPRVLQIIPRLVDNAGKPIDFKGATLETNMVVTSNGVQVLSSKNLMLDNNFYGFTIRFANLPANKIVDEKIDITVSVKTAKKTFKMTKVGVPVNSKAMRQQQVIIENPTEDPTTENPTVETPTSENPVIDNATLPKDPTKPKTPGEPKATVQNFLNNLSSQNLKNAYDASSNPNWGSYENFSNTNSGFGNVKKLNIKNIQTNSTSANTASVNATYDVVDKNGKSTALLVTFGLKNVNGEWKISSYKINQ